MYKVIIAGTRTFNDYEMLEDTCDRLLVNKRQTHKVCIVSGTANGADKLGERYARKRGMGILFFKPDWDREGRRAGIVRNCEMARNADGLIAFWDGKSRGTAHMIGEARRLGLSVRVVDINPQNYGQVQDGSRMKGLHR